MVSGAGTAEDGALGREKSFKVAFLAKKMIKKVCSPCVVSVSSYSNNSKCRESHGLARCLFDIKFASSALFFTPSFLKQWDMWLRTVADDSARALAAGQAGFAARATRSIQAVR